MDKERDSDGGSTSDASSHPYFFKRRPRFGEQRQVNMLKEVKAEVVQQGNSQQTSGEEVVRGVSDIMSKMSPIDFQNLVVRALVQSTMSLVGSSSGLNHEVGEAVIGHPPLAKGDSSATTTWTEEAYRKAEARRKRKPERMRTSAGEDSDSQEDFPLPENATAEQKSLRTRRLNRSRTKKARDLTSNRKAVKKLPYVIHVDGSGKPRGIHKQVWKAAVRGQCGRLDPSRDNINHHAKNVVDSLWHAIEKEWEFTGFAHKAREMFERGATKYLRNRKMQLKYKCKKNLPANDVHPTHWANIVDITKKVKKEEMPAESSRAALEEKEFTNDTCTQENKGRSEGQGSEVKKLKSTTEFPTVAGETVASEEDVDIQIKNLREQLMWLESTKKETVQQNPNFPDNFEDVVVHVLEKKGSSCEVRRVANVMKENVAPTSVTTVRECSTKSGKIMKSRDMNVDEKVESVPKKESGRCGSALHEAINAEEEKMECGDVISMVAFHEREEKDIGKGILMSFAGSKIARKVIPKGWCSIRVSSYTISGGSEECPFPLGWKDSVKHKTMKDADGRIILWPESLLHL